MATINKAGLDLIKEFEGCSLTAYQDSVGVWTIAWGQTGNVHPGDVITQAAADSMLMNSLITYEKGVEDRIQVDLNPNQFAALVSLTYNVGVAGCPGMWPLINAKDWQAAADHFLVYAYADGVMLEGLERRRKAERALFLTDLPQ